MTILVPIAFAAGFITVFTPCILPVLPIVLAGGTTGTKRRPYAIVAGLVTTFTVFVLAGAWVWSLLGIDAKYQDKIGAALLGVLALTLVVPAAAALLERPLAFLTRWRPPELGAAPDFRKISAWLNTPGLDLASLRGKVVLVDFWTYSCINCLRTLPYLERWDERYRSQGLVIVGVHSPEFAFEHDLSNVREATRRLGVRYPVALDNDYATWNAYSNQYWPAEYLLDQRGHVRHYHFGEGEYGRTEQLIRQLLAPERAHLPSTTAIADRTPMAVTTPESYLGYERLDRYAGSRIVHDRFAAYRFPATLPLDELAYGGSWLVGGERIMAGRDARLRLHFHAHDVYLVLGGSGTVRVLLDGRAVRTVRVTGDRLYTLRSGTKLREGLLELRFSPGVQAYAFTFG